MRLRVGAASQVFRYGRAEGVVVAGGAESLSNIPILHSRGMSDALVAASKAKSLPARLGALSKIRPKDLIPSTPAIAEPTTGESMGQSAERMANSRRRAAPRASTSAPAFAHASRSTTAPPTVSPTGSPAPHPGGRAGPCGPSLGSGWVRGAVRGSSMDAAAVGSGPASRRARGAGLTGSRQRQLRTMNVFVRQKRTFK